MSGYIEFIALLTKLAFICIEIIITR